MATTTKTKKSTKRGAGKRTSRGAPSGAAKAAGKIADAVTVTAENFEQLLLESAEQALAIHRGEMQPARATTLSARRVEAAPPPTYGAPRVKRVRQQLRLSQQLFADLMNVSGSTVRSWEQGTRVPDGASRRLLQVAERHPQVILDTLRERTPRERK